METNGTFSFGRSINWRVAGIALAGIAYVVIHLATLARSPTPWFDDTFFASVTQSLIQGGELRLPVSPLWMDGPIYVYGPVYFLITGFFFKYLGFGLFQFRIATLLFGLGIIWLVYWLLHERKISSHVAITTCVLLAFDPTFYKCIHNGRMDSVALFFILLSLLLMMKAAGDDQRNNLYRMALSGFFAGLAILTTPRPAYLLVPMGMILVYRWLCDRSRRRMLQMVVWGSVVVALYGLWFLYAFGSIEKLVSYYANVPGGTYVGGLHIRLEHYPLLLVLLILSISLPFKALVTTQNVGRMSAALSTGGKSHHIRRKALSLFRPTSSGDGACGEMPALREPLSRARERGWGEGGCSRIRGSEQTPSPPTPLPPAGEGRKSGDISEYFLDELTFFSLTGIIAFYLVVHDVGPYGFFMVPMAYLAIGCIAERHMEGRWRWLVYCLIGSLLFINGLSYIARNALVAVQWEARDGKEIERAIAQAIPSGSRVVGDDKYYFAVMNTSSDFQYLERGGSLRERVAYHKNVYRTDFVISAHSDESDVMKLYRSELPLIKLKAIGASNDTKIAQWIAKLASNVGFVADNGYQGAIWARVNLPTSRYER